jgi:predicted RNA-binding protein with PIN domain
MALHYLVDGYNLLYALPDIPPGPWPTKRDIFLKLLETSRPQGRNKLTVVFDNRQGAGERSMYGPVEVVFTSGESADDWLIMYVRKTDHPRTCVVVTNDQAIRRLIRGTGARWMNTRDFLKPTLRESPNTPERLDSGTQDEITEEFKKRWL